MTHDALAFSSSMHSRDPQSTGHGTLFCRAFLKITLITSIISKRHPFSLPPTTWKCTTNMDLHRALSKRIVWHVYAAERSPGSVMGKNRWIHAWVTTQGPRQASQICHREAGASLYIWRGGVEVWPLLNPDVGVCRLLKERPKGLLILTAPHVKSWRMT